MEGCTLGHWLEHCVQLAAPNAFLEKQSYIKWGVNFFVLGLRRVLPPKLLGAKHISNLDVAPF